MPPFHIRHFYIKSDNKKSLIKKGIHNRFIDPVFNGVVDKMYRGFPSCRYEAVVGNMIDPTIHEVRDKIQELESIYHTRVFVRCSD